MKFFGVPPPSTTDAVRGRRMTRFADSTMSPMMSMWPAPGVVLPRLRQAHADRRIGNRRAEDRHVGAIGGGQDAVAAGRRSRGGRRAGSRNSRVRVRPRLERRREVGNPVVVADELFFAGVGVVDAIDADRPPAPHRRRAASRGSDAGRAFRADRDTGSRRSRRGSRRSDARSGARRSGAGRRR